MVYARQNPPPALLRLATAQGDVLSSEQVQAFGFSRRAVSRLVAAGQWQQLAHGLNLTRSGAADWDARSWGGVLLGGENARLGGRAAAHLWGLTDEPDEIEVLVPSDRSMRRRSSWRFIREEPGLRLPSRGSPPRICVEDAVIDLCSVVGEAEMVGFVTAAVQQRLTHPGRLIRRIEQRGRVRHRRLMLELLGDVAEGSESPLEVHYVRDVERAHGLPVGERQQKRGGHVHDVRYRRFRTVVELDGRLGHTGMGRFRDMRRDNLALLRGDATLRYGWADVRGHKCQVAWQVGSVLMDRGWEQLPTRCPDCRSVPLAELGVA